MAVFRGIQTGKGCRLEQASFNFDLEMLGSTREPSHAVDRRGQGLAPCTDKGAK